MDTSLNPSGGIQARSRSQKLLMIIPKTGDIAKIKDMANNCYKAFNKNALWNMPFEPMLIK